MLGNPYSSNDPDLGPLMREIKNKICRDCELVALLEDDNGMELLVNNKIISLDLPVKDVYQKVWLPEMPEISGEPMRIIYRMRGLLGVSTTTTLQFYVYFSQLIQDFKYILYTYFFRMPRRSSLRLLRTRKILTKMRKTCTGWLKLWPIAMAWK